MPPTHQDPPALTRAAPGSLAVLNAGVVAVAALYFGRELLVPMVLAVLLAFVLAPAVALLQRARLGHTLPVFIAVLLAFAVIGGIGLVVGRQVTALADDVPRYQVAIAHKVANLPFGHALTAELQKSVPGLLGAPVEDALPAGLGATRVSVAVVPPSRQAAAAPDAATLVIVRTVVQPLLPALATFGVVLIFVVFVLLFREDLRDRLVRLMGRQDLHRTILAMNDAAHRLSRFFLFQVAINAGFGAFIAIGLAIAGLPNPVLWGILAALMRFVPFLGTFIAVSPPLLLALAVAPGWSLAVIVLVLFGASELIMGQVVEPLLYGHSTGLSPIAVILAATFWAFLWGPVGLLLATPLTVCLVVIGRHVESLRFLEVMLGDSPPLDAEETFYQRALEGNGHELAKQARLAATRSSLADYYDHVALPGLALAQADLSRDALAFDRLEAIHQHIDTLLGQLGAAGVVTATATPPDDWRRDGAVLCIPGRGQLDDLAARMAMQVLRQAGFGASCETNLILGGREASPAALQGVRLVCLSVLEQGSSPQAIRYLLRRVVRQMPQAAAAVCLWHADGASPTLAALRSEGAGEMIVLSLGELAALTRAICARRRDGATAGRTPTVPAIGNIPAVAAPA